MPNATPKLINPCGGSNFIAFMAVKTHGGVVIQPKAFPVGMAVGMTSVIGLFGIGMLILTQRVGGPVILMSLPVLLGTFGPAVAIWFQTQHAQKRGLVLKFNQAKEEVELPRIQIRLPRQQVQCLWLVSNKLRELTQLQIQTTAGQAYALVTTMEKKALSEIGSVVATALAVPIKTCDNAPEDEGDD